VSLHTIGCELIICEARTLSLCKVRGHCFLIWRPIKWVLMTIWHKGFAYVKKGKHSTTRGWKEERFQEPHSSNNNNNARAHFILLLCARERKSSHQNNMQIKWCMISHLSPRFLLSLSLSVAKQIIREALEITAKYLSNPQRPLLCISTRSRSPLLFKTPTH